MTGNFFIKIKKKIKAMLSANYTPKEIAFAYSLGVLIGISPYLGFHTYIALSASAFLKLPLYPVVLGAYITNPVTIPFIYAFTIKVGYRVLHMTPITSDIKFKDLRISEIFETGKEFFLPFFVGTHLVGIISAIIAYVIALIILNNMKKVKERNLK